jgi:hypothetical protein
LTGYKANTSTIEEPKLPCSSTRGKEAHSILRRLLSSDKAVHTGQQQLAGSKEPSMMMM